MSLIESTVAQTISEVLQGTLQKELGSIMGACVGTAIVRQSLLSTDVVLKTITEALGGETLLHQ